MDHETRQAGTEDAGMASAAEAVPNAEFTDEEIRTATEELNKIIDENQPSVSHLAIRAIDEGRRFLENLSQANKV